MNNQKKSFDIIFSILSLIELNYLIPIAEKLIDNGYTVGFILFHDAAKRPLKEKNIPFFSVHELRKIIHYKPINNELIEFQNEYGIGNIRNLFIREKLGYNRKNEDDLINKTVHYLQIIDTIFKENDVKCVMQTTGAVAANQAVFYAARKNMIDHVFFEHSPFNQMALFLLNTYSCEIPDTILEGQIRQEDKVNVENYIKGYNKSKFLRAAYDNKHLYSDMTIKKILNIQNISKLKRKVVHKYITKEKEEYDEIGWVIRQNFSRLIQRMLLTRYYTKYNNSTEKYIYFPLHVPSDTQLLIRSPMFQFQEWFLEYLCRCIPFGYKLYVKEHPAAVGGYWNSIITKLIKDYHNVSLMHPKTNSYDLIKNASLVVTINSSVGFEALFQNKKVLVVGDSYYKNKGVTFDLFNLNELGDAINKALNSCEPDKEKVLNFLTKVYQWSYPCALFQPEEKSFEAFYNYLRTERFRRLKIQ